MQLGYLGILSLMVLSPIPPELFMPLAGFLVAQKQLDFVSVVAMGVIGFLLSILPWYFAGRLLGEERLLKLAERIRWFKLPVNNIQTGQRWFKQHGIKAIFVCLLIPGTRNLIMLPAGLSGIPTLAFLISTTIGAVLWLGGLTSLGYFLGDRYHLVSQHFGIVPVLVLVAGLSAAGVWAINYYGQQKDRTLKRW